MQRNNWQLKQLFLSLYLIKKVDRHFDLGLFQFVYLSCVRGMLAFFFYVKMAVSSAKSRLRPELITNIIHFERNENKYF